eukprot:2954765-Rhodomonas_salina.5
MGYATTHYPGNVQYSDGLCCHRTLQITQTSRIKEVLTPYGPTCPLRSARYCRSVCCCGTEEGCMLLRTCYAMSGTEIGCAATRSSGLEKSDTSRRCSLASRRVSGCAAASTGASSFITEAAAAGTVCYPPTQYPVLTSHMALNIVLRDVRY